MWYADWPSSAAILSFSYSHIRMTSMIFHNISRPLSVPDPSTLFREEVGGNIAITKVSSHLSKQRQMGII